MPAYVPPALRGVAGQQAEGQPKLTERVWRVKVEYSTGGPFDVSACPETLLPIAEADRTSEVTVRHFELPSDASTAELKALLSWFGKASAAVTKELPHGDARCQLVFPPSLSKETRKLLHASAEALQLPTFSKGLGDERRLAVHGAAFRGTPEMESEVAAAAAAARRRVPGPVRERAKQIWRWCQADGGALWSLSQGELEEALMAAPDEAALPGPVKDLLERRKHGTELIAAIRAGDTSAALAVLEAHPRSAWIRDDGGPPGGGGAGGGDPQGGCYPLHLAALAGLGEVVERIAVQPGTVEQRDRNYATPLKVAKKAGQAAMVEILLRHGAKDYEVNQAAHKTAATSIPTGPPAGHGHTRRGSGGGSHGNSPAAGSPAMGSSPAGGTGAAFMAAHAAGRQRRSSIELHPHHPHPATPTHPAGGGQSAQTGSHAQVQSGTGSGHTHQTHHQHQHQHQGGSGHHAHGPSGLGGGHRHGDGGGGRRNAPEEHHPPAGAHGSGGSHGTAHDPTVNPFAILASAETGSNSRRGSGGGASGLPPRPPSVGNSEAGAASGSDSDTGGGGGSQHSGRGGGRGAGGGGGRVKHTGNWRPLPPIQSGEVSEASVLAALAQLGLSVEPNLSTAAEAEAQEEAAGGGGNAGPAGSGGEEDAAGGDDAAPKKRKTRRGRRGRGSRRQSAASIDEAMAAAASAAIAAAIAAGDLPGDAERVSTPVQEPPPVRASVPQGPGTLVQEHHHRSGSGAAGGPSGVSSEHSITDASDSEDGGGDSANGARTRRGGQPARSRRHERRRAARVSGADGSPPNRQSATGNTPSERKTRRSSGTDYSSFHQGGAHGQGHAAHRGGSASGGHYQVYGGGHHHGHADDVGSWRREPGAPSPAAPSVAAAGTTPPLAVRDEPRPPAGAGGRAPAVRRTSAGTGLPPLPAAGPAALQGGGVLPEAPGSPFHHGNSGAAMHGPREHVAAGPVAGFGFGRGRGRAVTGPAAPGGCGPPSAPGSPARGGPEPAITTAPGSVGATLGFSPLAPAPSPQPQTTSTSG